MSRWRTWLADRLGLPSLRHHLLEKPLPPGTGWWFTLGSVLLFGLSVQMVTGAALALFYAPTPDHAWDSVRYITASVPGGSFLRGLHFWGASMVVVAAVLHLVRVVAFGSYRPPREITWMSGILLLLVILGLGLTGYLLPWDQRAYWATVVTTNIAGLVPIGGDAAAALLRGGTDVGALTLTRWYAAHVIVLPALLVGLVVLHLYLMRRHGISGPVRPRSGAARPFFPDQAARDLTVSFGVGIVWTSLAWGGAPALEAPADPTSSSYAPRPEWYFLGLFQLLKYFPGQFEVVGAVVVPVIALAWLILLPWIDRGRSRAWRDRTGVIGVFVAGLAGVAALTVLGAIDRPAVRSSESWSPLEIGGAALIEGDRCTRCHTDEGLAGPIEPGRITRARDWLATHVRDPEVIGPGVRPAARTDEGAANAIQAALLRLRTGPPPAVDEATRDVFRLFAQHCAECHQVNGSGGTEGPDLSQIGVKLDVETIALQIYDPFEIDQNALMPAFGDVLWPEEIDALAEWLAGLE